MGDLTNIKILCREIIKEVEEKHTKIHKLEERISKAIEYIENEETNNNSNWICRGREDLLDILINKGKGKEKGRSK